MIVFDMLLLYPHGPSTHANTAGKKQAKCSFLKAHCDPALDPSQSLYKRYIHLASFRVTPEKRLKHELKQCNTEEWWVRVFLDPAPYGDKSEFPTVALFDAYRCTCFARQSRRWYWQWLPLSATAFRRSSTPRVWRAAIPSSVTRSLTARHIKKYLMQQGSWPETRRVQQRPDIYRLSGSIPHEDVTNVEEKGIKRLYIMSKKQVFAQCA